MVHCGWSDIGTFNPTWRRFGQGSFFLGASIAARTAIRIKVVAFSPVNESEEEVLPYHSDKY